MLNQSLNGNFSMTMSRNSQQNTTILIFNESSLKEVLSKPSILGISIFLVLQILLTIVGNVLVLRTLRVTKRLHSAGYFFIASLACADLLVGILVIPVSLIYYITFNMKGRKKIYLNQN